MSARHLIQPLVTEPYYDPSEPLKLRRGPNMNHIHSDENKGEVSESNNIYVRQLVEDLKSRRGSSVKSFTTSPMRIPIFK